MNEFFKKNKKNIFSVLFLLAILVAISIISMVLLSVFGILNFDDGIKFNADMFDEFKASWYGWVIFIILQSGLSMLLCFIPGMSMAFIILSTYLFTETWQAFTLSFTSVISSSCVMYLLGRYGGYKLCVKLLGEEDCQKATTILRNKGTVYFPLMMLFPFFPDDALVMISGVSKMSLKWFLPSIFIARGIGIATIIFGLSIIPFDKFTSLYDWIVFITVCAFWLIVIFYLAGKLNKKLDKKNHSEKNKN